MIDATLTRIVRFAAKHDRALAIASGAWFVLSCAVWIPQLPIPEIPYVTDRNSWMLSGPWNALWWGFAYPALEKKRKEIEAAEQSSDGPQISQD